MGGEIQREWLDADLSIYLLMPPGCDRDRQAEESL